MRPPLHRLGPRRSVVVLALAILAGGAGDAFAAPAFDQYAPVAPGPEGDRHVSDGRLDRDHDALADAVRERMATETGDPTLRPRRTSSPTPRDTQSLGATPQAAEDRADFAPATGGSLIDNLFSTFGLAMAGLALMAVMLLRRGRARPDSD